MSASEDIVRRVRAVLPDVSVGTMYTWNAVVTSLTRDDGAWSRKATVHVGPSQIRIEAAGRAELASTPEQAARRVVALLQPPEQS